MSDTSYFVGYYSQIRDFAELVDKALIELKTNKDFKGENHRQKLGELLVNSASSEENDVFYHNLQLILHEKFKAIVSDWGHLGEEIISSNVSGDTLKRLEKVADLLEQERAGVFAKIRGR